MEPTGDRGSLVARIGPNEPGGIVLSAHSDVVPVDGQEWTVPPWELTAKGGRLYGRGTADMKGFIACCLELLPRIASEALKRPVILAISHDEEIGCKGAPLMIAHIKNNVPRPASVIVGEPTAMRVVDAHKGIAVFETNVHGSAAHSSQTHIAASANLAAAQLVAYLGGIAGDQREQRTARSAFDPPYTTLNVGELHGGHAFNIVAEQCKFTWDVRAVSADDPQAIVHALQRYAEQAVLPWMRTMAPQSRVETRELVHAPPLSALGDVTAKRLALTITGDESSIAVSFATEAGLFQQAGFSAAVCGPGSIDQAHRADEFVELSQLQACSRFLAGLVDELRT
jgi:acetylornithine deacetylase